LDDVQYTRKDWRNRNRLKSHDGIKMVSVPIRKGTGRDMLINQARINDDQPWREKLIAQIRQWYRQAPYLQDIFPHIRDVLQRPFEYLVDLNYTMDKVLAGLLGIHTPTFLSSGIAGKSSDRNQKIVDICLHHQADFLYDGQAARAFIDPSLFKKNGIQVVFQDYQCTPYPQQWGDFVSHLSVLDLLMNCGASSKNVLTASPLPAVLTTKKRAM
jgi:hypothetical protein